MTKQWSNKCAGHTGKLLLRLKRRLSMKSNPLLPHEVPDDHDFQHEGLPKIAEEIGPIDMSPAALIASLKSNIISMKKNTTTARGTRIVPMIYVWKNGKALVTVLRPSAGENPNFTPESLGRFASQMGKDAEAAGVGLIYD